MGEPRTLKTHPEMNSLHSFPVFRALGERPKNGLEKFLSLFADVRAGEGIGVVLLTLNTFLLLSSYYLLKTARESLILTEGGAEVKTYSSAGQAILLLLLVPVYGWVGTRVNRVKLVTGLTLFFASHLAFFALAGSQGVNEGVVFFIWVGIFSVFVISQFWAFVNDLYTEGQGRRLFPLIGVGSSVGALAGSQAAERMFTAFNQSPYMLMGIAGVVLVVAASIVAVVNKLELRRGDARQVKESEQTLSSEGGFGLVLRDRYLFWIAVLIILLNVVNTSGEYLLGRLITGEAAARGLDSAASRRFIGGFYGSYFTWVNGISLVLQAFGVSRLFRYVGVRGSLFFLPVIGLVSYSVLAVAPLLRIVRVVKTLENAADYSVQNTVQQAVWLPTTREAKYKAKAVVDTFCKRLGDVVAAGVVFVGTGVAGLSTSQFAWVNVGLIAGWLWVAGRIAREHRKRTV